MVRISEEQKEDYRLNSDWHQGYGYQMWCCRYGAVRIHGAWGQLCIIIPEKNAVVVTTSYIRNEKNLIDSIWKNIYANL